MSYKRKSVWKLLDSICIAIAISGTVFVVYQGLGDKQNQDLRILAVSFLPLLFNNIVMAVRTKETIISGIPNTIKKQDNPDLFWIIVLLYLMFLIFIIGYLIIKGLPW